MTPQDLAEVTERLAAADLTRRFDGKRVIVTGARGFLGQAFTEVFSAIGAEVIAIDRYALAHDMGALRAKTLPNVENVDHDVTKPFPVYGRIDYILSLAAIASPVHYAKRPLDCFDVIVHGTRNMLELAGLKGARMLLSSTSELYGDSGWGGTPMREHALGPLDPWDVRGRAYDVPRLAAEALASIFSSRGVPVRTVRYFNIFGPPLSPNDHRVMSRFGVAAVQGKPLRVHGAGPGLTRSFCYVTDAIVGTLIVLTSDESRPVNVGNPEEVSMSDLADKIAAAAVSIGLPRPQVELEDPSGPYAKQPRRRCPDIERLCALGFKPQVSLDVGIQRFLTWASEAYK